MLDWYIGERMVSRTNINDGINEPTHGYQNVIPVKYWYLVGISQWESLYTQVIIWANTILHNTDTSTILPRYKGSCMVYRSEWYQKQNNLKYPLEKR